MNSEIKILIVDDELSLINVLQDYLTDESFNVEVAYSGNEGIAKAKDSVFDLIISDVKMPDGDGLEFIKQIKADSANRKTKFVFMSAFADINKDAANELGAIDVWYKPLHLADLRGKIMDILKN